MSASNPGLVRRFFGGVWRVVDVSRRVVLNLIFLLFLAVVVLALVRAGRRRWPRRRRWCSTSTARSPSRARATCARRRSTGCAARRAAEDAAARHPRRARRGGQGRRRSSSVVLILDELEADRPRDPARDRAAVDRFRASGKKVVAWGSSFDQRQYYIAAHADEVYLHPIGTVYSTASGVPQLLQGRARQARRQRQRAARRHLQELRRAVHRQRAVAGVARGRRALYGALWKTYTDAVEKLRKLAARLARMSHRRAAAALAAVGGDAAKLALDDKLVDGLKTRDELRALLIARGARTTSTRPSARSRSTSTSARLRPRLPATRSASSSPRARSSTAARRPARSAACRPPT